MENKEKNTKVEESMSSAGMMDVVKKSLSQPLSSVTKLTDEKNMNTMYVMFAIAVLSIALLVGEAGAFIYNFITFGFGGRYEVDMVELILQTTLYSVGYFGSLVGTIYLIMTQYLKKETAFKKVATILIVPLVFLIIGSLTSYLLIKLGMDFSIIVLVISATSLLTTVYLYEGVKTLNKGKENLCAYFLADAIIVASIVTGYILPKIFTNM